MEGAVRVAVVGGGPGGAHCARRLAESGCAVTLFEPRDRHEKACGGGMPARALETFPFLLDAPLDVKTIRRCRLIAPSGREADVPLADPLYVFRRADLHRFLLDRAAAAGATLRRERVVSFERAGEGTAAAWSLRVAPPGDPAGPFDFLVAADGAAG